LTCFRSHYLNILDKLKRVKDSMHQPKINQTFSFMTSVLNFRRIYLPFKNVGPTPYVEQLFPGKVATALPNTTKGYSSELHAKECQWVINFCELTTFNPTK